MAAAWRSALSKSLEANKAVPYRKFMQLGTVRTDGRPSVRTVVFRGFHNDTDQITFTTDTRHAFCSARHLRAAHACSGPGDIQHEWEPFLSKHAGFRRKHVPQDVQGGAPAEAALGGGVLVFHGKPRAVPPGRQPNSSGRGSS